MNDSDPAIKFDYSDRFNSRYAAAYIDEEYEVVRLVQDDGGDEERITLSYEQFRTMADAVVEELPGE